MSREAGEEERVDGMATVDEALKAALEEAKRGNLAKVAVVGVRPDGEIMLALAPRPSAALLAAVSTAQQYLASRATNEMHTLGPEW